MLALGDVVGVGGCEYLSGGRLRRMRDILGAQLVIVNGENSAVGNALSPESAEAIFEAGADVITGGNHTFKKKQIYDYLDTHPMAIRPANYPSDAPGDGWCIADCMGWRVLVINLLGTTFMDSMDSPFKTVDRILMQNEGRYDACLVDFHAEATSEKLCLGRYLDGRASAVFGTHTHVQTADAAVLPGGTGYITDLGMTGSMAGVLGVRTQCIIHKFTVRTPVYFEPAEGDYAAHGALFTVDTDTGLCTEAVAISF
ncbi:MAG: YmdB family metallophosphoesterase [Clostridia bacterium]|nr:YmdB family metallophosphoesterase [Clostridia bacterium]